MLAVTTYLHTAWLAHTSWLARQVDDDERGQASAEYALVLLGAAAVALLVVAWATKTDKIGDLLDFVFDRIRRSTEE